MTSKNDSAPPELKSGHSLTLTRGLHVLRVLADEPDGLLVSQLAEALHTHRAGIYRLLGPLIDTRLVRRTAGGRHVLAGGLIELATRVQFPLLEVARPELQRLADGLAATTALTLREDDEAVVALVVEPRTATMHITYRSGLRHSVNIAAPGIALLAGNPPRPGERAEVVEAREKGYAWSRGELLPGATGVAAPIYGPKNEVEAAISAVWADERDEEAVRAPLLESARRIELELGSRATPPHARKDDSLANQTYL